MYWNDLYEFPGGSKISDLSQILSSQMVFTWETLYISIKGNPVYIRTSFVTVQEQHVTYHAHTLANWLTGYGSNGHVDDSFAFLPSQLNADMLLYPSVSNLFEDLAVHRLCFFVGKQ